MALAALVFILIHSTVQNVQVEGFSMEPNLNNGEFVLINKVIYSRYKVASWMERIPLVDRDKNGIIEPFRAPKRGEVIVLKSPEERDRNLIKRVIAIPGDTVSMNRGVVSVNGVALNEARYIPRPGTYSMAPVRIPKDEYWVMGDNRTGSSDSRSFGPVPRGNIVGKAWISYWPLKSLGFIKTYWTKLA